MTVQAIDKRDGVEGTLPDPRVALLVELAEPLRLRVIDRLSGGGPATVSELACDAGVSMPQLSNHLKRLREAGLVQVERNGRHAVYEIADPGLDALLPMLDSITGRVVPPPERVGGESRTCYAHLAGPLGVAVFRGLVDRGAIVPAPDGTVALGPTAADVFGALAVETDQDAGDRRRFAFECLDGTEHAAHLAGTMGDRVAASLFERGWVERIPGRRTVRVTPAGARGLKRTLGVTVDTDR